MEKTKVLLIEDDESFGLLVARMLGPDYEVRQEVTLTRGLQVIGEQEVDVVLLDLMLPDSEDASGTLRKFFEKYIRVAVLILSNYSDPDLMIKSIEVGAQGYLIKGRINSDWLRSAVFQAVLIRQTERRHREQLGEIFQELYSIWEEESVGLYRVARTLETDRAEFVYNSAEKISDRLAKLAKLIRPELMHR
jgi:DNA-binding NarL/FixJ family response regulator